MIKDELWNKVLDDLKRISTALKMLTEELDRFFIDVSELRRKNGGEKVE
jgi:hypothetical protein